MHYFGRYTMNGWRLLPHIQPEYIPEDERGDDDEDVCWRMPDGLPSLNKATTDDAKLRKLFKKWPEAPMGLALKPMGFGSIEVRTYDESCTSTVADKVLELATPTVQYRDPSIDASTWWLLFEAPDSLTLDYAELERDVWFDRERTVPLPCPDCPTLRWVVHPYEARIGPLPDWLIDALAAEEKRQSFRGALSRLSDRAS